MQQMPIENGTYCFVLDSQEELGSFEAMNILSARQISGQLLSNHDIPRPHDQPSERVQFCQSSLCAVSLGCFRFVSFGSAQFLSPGCACLRPLSPDLSPRFTLRRPILFPIVSLGFALFLSPAFAQCPWFRLVSLGFFSCQVESLLFFYVRSSSPDFAQFRPVSPGSSGFAWFRTVSPGCAQFRLVSQ